MKRGRDKKIKKGYIKKWQFCLLVFFALILFFNGIKPPKAANDPALPATRDSGASSSISSMISGQVNPFSGTFSTGIPIEIPPGRNGLQPALALSYGSTNTIGVAGVGWDIPASSIIRIGANRGTPRYDSTDEFYLNLNGSSSQLKLYSDGSYHTRIESWSKVVPSPNSSTPQYWTVTSRSGETYTFGSSTSPSSYSYQKSLSPGYFNSWMLSKIKDIDGNTVEWTYSPSSQCTGCGYYETLLPRTIKYGANETAGYNHFAEIDFVYEGFPSGSSDLRSSYFFALGAPIRQDRRLTHIQVKNLLNNVVLRDYTLTYAQSTFTNRSLLQNVSITARTPDGSSTYTIPKNIEFEYSAMEDANNPIPYTEISGSAFDIPGPAFVQDVYYSDGPEEYPYQFGTAMMDINNDGLPDKVTFFKSHNSTTNETIIRKEIDVLHIDQNGNRSWTQVTDPSIPGNPVSLIWYDSNTNLDMGVRFGDVNGDGLADKIDYYDDDPTDPFDTDAGSFKIYLAINDPNNTNYPGWDNTPIEVPIGQKGLKFSHIWKDQNLDWQSYSTGSILIDVNGDGYVDKVDATDFFDKYLNTPLEKIRGVYLGTGSGFDAKSATWAVSGDIALVKVVRNILSINGNVTEFRVPTDRGVRLIDLNGDGLPDFVRYAVVNNSKTLKVWWNNGSGWNSTPIEYGSLDFGQAFTNISPNTDYSDDQANDRGSMTFDINGDGLPDKIDRFVSCYQSPPNDNDVDNNDCNNKINEVHINIGNAYEGSSRVYFAVHDSFFPWDASPPDATLPEHVSFSQKYYKDANTSHAQMEAARDLGVRVTDLNGDGYPDFVKYFERYNGNNDSHYAAKYIQLSSPQKGTTHTYAGSARRDYLVYIKNPIGGTTEIKYASASEFYQAALSSDPEPSTPSAPWVVESVTAGDGKGAFYQTKYEYYSPKFDIIERQFAGFGRVKVTSPDNQKTETFYNQNYPLTGMADTVKQYASGADTPYITSNTTYEVIPPYNPNLPDNIYHVHKLTDRKTETDTGGSITTGVDYKKADGSSGYDAYDNLTTVITWGDINNATDDKRVETEYINSESLWLLGFAKRSATYDSSSVGNITSDKYIYYDGLALGSISKGKITSEQSWLNNDTSGGTQPGPVLTYETGRTAYNTADGTVASVTQPNAGRGTSSLITTFSAYDSTHRFPITTKKNWGVTDWSSSATYDIWGHTLTLTDIKGILTTNAFDALGRPLTTVIKLSSSSPSITTKSYDYTHAFDGPLTQYVSAAIPSPPSSAGTCSPAILSSFSFYDGLGRTYKTTWPGWNGQCLSSETAYDSAGRVSSKSRPHFCSSTPIYYIIFSYDTKSRVVSETGFGKTKTYSYAISSSTFKKGIDIANHFKETFTDVYGRIVKVDSDTSEPLYYFYDNMGSLTHVSRNSSGMPKLVTLSYDSFGRKLSYIDSDTGVTTYYFYDLAGRLIKQEDKGTNGSKLTTQLYYNGDQGKLSQKIIGSGSNLIEVDYGYYGASNNLNAGEINTVTNKWQLSGVDSAQRQTTETYSRSISTNCTIQSSVVYSIPWKEDSTSPTTLSLTFKSVSDWMGNLIETDLPDSAGTGSEVIKTNYQNTSGYPTSVTDGVNNLYAQYTEYNAEHLTEWNRGQSANIKTQYGFNPDTDHLTDVTTTNSSNSSTLQHLSFTYRNDDLLSSSNESISGYNQSFTYDDQLHLETFNNPSGLRKYCYSPSTGSTVSDNITNSDDRTLTYGYTSRPHQVSSDTTGNGYIYDSWGRLYQTLRATETTNYTYDNWNRLRRIAKNGTVIADYEYFGDGERFKKKTYDNGVPYEHVTLPGYEVEQLKNGCVRLRWAITGPTGIIAWKQSIQNAGTFAKNVNRQSEYQLASIAFDKFYSDITNPPPAPASGGQFALSFALRNSPFAIYNSFRQSLSALGDLYSALSHYTKAVSLDPEEIRNYALLFLILTGLLLSILLYSKKTQKLLTLFFFHHSPFAPRHSHFPSLFGPLTHPVFVNTARILILTLLFQGGAILTPLTVQAQTCPSPCNEIFYPLSDHLGTVVTLLDHNGNKVYEQHYLPFGQKDKANSSKTAPNCNNNEASWPYGFTGQFTDEESGLIYMHARYYNPNIAHFITPDSVLGNPGDSLSYDRYAYTRNNPINLIDPTGNNPLIVAAIIVAAIVGGYQAYRAHQPVVTGMFWGAAQAAAAIYGGPAGAMAIAAIHAQVYGGNPIRAALIAGVSFAVSYYASMAFSAMGQAIFPMSTFGQGMINILGSGIVGGLTSVALGGKFSEGFAYGAGAALLQTGISYAAEEIQGQVENQQTTENAPANQKTGEVVESPPPNKTIPKQPVPDWNSTVQDPDVVCEMQASAERVGLNQKNFAARSEESVVMIRNVKTGTYRIMTNQGTESSTNFNAGEMLPNEEIYTMWHVHTYNGTIAGRVYWENPNLSPSDPTVYSMMGEAPWAGNMYVLGPNYIWHYDPIGTQFIPVTKTSFWLGMKTYP